MGLSLSRITRHNSSLDAVWLDTLLNYEANSVLLMTLSRVDKRFRQLVRQVYRIRLLRQILHFISSNHLGNFLHLLKTNRSVIGGSVAQAIIDPARFRQVGDEIFDEHRLVTVPHKL